jgi:hypothetical protein
MKEFEEKLITTEDAKASERGVSNFGFHYLWQRQDPCADGPSIHGCPVAVAETKTKKELVQ